MAAAKTSPIYAGGQRQGRGGRAPLKSRLPIGRNRTGMSKMQLFTTTQLVRLSLLLSLVAILLHQAALHHRSAGFDSNDSSDLEELESKRYGFPTSAHHDVFRHSVPYSAKAQQQNAHFAVAPHAISLSAQSSRVSDTSDTRYVPAPEPYAKLAYFYGNIHHKLYEPVSRAFHSRGWSRTQDKKRAHVIWYDQPDDLEDIYRTVKPWQRINQLPNTDKWDDKDSMALNINAYYAANKRTPLHSFPESYVLNNQDHLKRFQERLSLRGGMDLPWVIKRPTVNQGKGVTIVGPHSQELQEILDLDPSRKRKKRLVVQRYICDEMTYDGRKFDFRVFWMVASVDPLIVLYHTRHNYVRIGHAKYDESDFNNTKSHLTTHTFGAEEKKATWDEFKAYIEEYQALQGPRLAHLNEDPFAHVQNQIKQVLSTLVDAYRNITFHPRDFASQNAFSLHAADMIVNNDLDVFLIEGTDGPGKDEDYDFRIAMHNSIFGSLVDIFEEITEDQIRGDTIDLNGMKERGVLGDYEVIYQEDWMYEYSRYNDLRVANTRGCGGSNKKFPVVQNVPMERVVAKALTTAVPKHIAAMGFESKLTPTKLFYMEGRTKKKGEMVTRAFRRNGWTPVDFVDMAQIVYDKEQPTEELADDTLEATLVDRKLQPWQFYNRLPMSVDHELHKWSNLMRYTHSSKRGGSVCRPIQFNGRDFSIHAYMLIVSWDPLIVYYHDGYLDIAYSRVDENEFVTISDDDDVKKVIWRGSWMHLKAMVEDVWKSLSTAASPPVALEIENAYDHVRNQFKHTLAKAGRGLAQDLSELLGAYRNAHATTAALSRYYGIYRATFQVDRNLNAFLSDLDSWNIAYGESYQDIVDLDDDVFGSAFSLVEAVNATISGAKESDGSSFRLQKFEEQTKNASGGYELLNFDPMIEERRRQEATDETNVWSYEYLPGNKAADCSRNESQD